jgi:hypothetical protein
MQSGPWPRRVSRKCPFLQQYKELKIKHQKKKIQQSKKVKLLLTSLETYLPRKIVFNEKMESKFQMHSANI